jgi:hypothetical protein
MEVFHLRNGNKRSFAFCYQMKAAIKEALARAPDISVVHVMKY